MCQALKRYRRPCFDLLLFCPGSHFTQTGLVSEQSQTAHSVFPPSNHILNWLQKKSTMKSFNTMRSKLIAISLGLLAFVSVVCAEEEAKPIDPYFANFHPLKAPAPRKNFLKPGDRLAICGDSITEQKMYSRIMETYLTVCVPELNVSVRQFGWSGEKAPGFLARMTNDCLRFKPTIATTCYGMNDHLYRIYTGQIGEAYRSNSTAIVEAFKARGVRVIQGSAGYVGRTLNRKGDNGATMEDLNLNLCQLRNIGLEIAKKEKVGFADVFLPMFVAAHEAQLKYGTNFILSGPDGVHPRW